MTLRTVLGKEGEGGNDKRKQRIVTFPIQERNKQRKYSLIFTPCPPAMRFILYRHSGNRELEYISIEYSPEMFL